MMIRLDRRFLAFILLSEALLLVHLSACSSIGAAQPSRFPRKSPEAHDMPVLPEILLPCTAITRALWEDGVLLVFEGKVGEVVTIHAISKTPGLDPTLVLLDPEQKEEASDDDSGSKGNSLIKRHVLKKSGRYTVRVRAAQVDGGEVEVLLCTDGVGSRAYEEALQRFSEALPISSPPELLVPGKAVTRTLWKDGILLFFEGRVGEVVTIHVTSKTPGLDPHVALLDSELKEEASDDDSGGQGNSLIKDHALKKSALYAVHVGAPQADGGTVEVLLTKGIS
jgi:hypothetical protein